MKNDYKYYICDVFTKEQFRGNQLAVLPHAEELTGEQMQAIAREFNFSETAFVLPPEEGQTRRVRIFTPQTEVPFAGHPNIGTAFVLARTGELDSLRNSRNIVFEEKAGLVAVAIEYSKSGEVRCELEAPQALSLGNEVDVGLIGEALSLDEPDIVQTPHAPRFASVGLPFIFVELTDLAALGRCKVNMEGFHKLAAQGQTPDIFVYVRTDGKPDIRARMFAPLDGVPEDPATGSANCALAGLLAHYDPAPSGKFTLEIDQGVEMGRPSRLETRVEKRDGIVTATWIAGNSVMVAEGTLFLH